MTAHSHCHSLTGKKGHLATDIRLMCTNSVMCVYLCELECNAIVYECVCVCVCVCMCVCVCVCVFLGLKKGGEMGLIR